MCSSDLGPYLNHIFFTTVIPATKRQTMFRLDAENTVLRHHGVPLTTRQRRMTIIFSWVMSCMV